MQTTVVAQESMSYTVKGYETALVGIGGLSN